MVENRSLHHLLPTHGHPSAVPSPLNVPYVPPQPYVHVMQPSPSTHAQSQYYPLPTSAVPPSLIPAHIPTSVVQPSIGIHPSRPAITSGCKTEEAPVSKPQERAGGSARDVSHSKPVESARRDQPTGGRSGNRLGGGERSRSRLLDRDGGQLSSPRPPSEREGDQTASQQATNSLPISLGGEEMHSVGVAPSASWPLPASGPAHAQFDAVATPPSSTPPTSAGLTTPSASSATPPTTLVTPPTSSVPAMPPPSSLTKLSGSATLLANSGQESQFEASPASTALVTATAATSILTSTSSTFTTPPVRSTEVVSMATASVSAAPLVKSAEASSQEVMEPNDLDQVTSTRSEERRTEEVVRASLTGGQSEGGVPVYTQATPTSSQATPTSSHATPTPPMAATCVSNSRPTHTFAVAASTNLHVVVSAMTSEPVSVLPTQVPTAYAPQASDVAHPLLTSTQGTISPLNMVADQSLHHSLPTHGYPSAVPSPLNPPYVPPSQPSVHVMLSSPLTSTQSLYYPLLTSAVSPSLIPAPIPTSVVQPSPLTHAQSHFMLGLNYSSASSFSASNLSSKQTMTSSFGTSTSPSIPRQSRSSLNVPMQSRLPPSLPTHGYPSAVPSPLNPPYVPPSQPSVHVMQSSPLTSLYYPPTSAAPPSLTPAHISTPLTHAQSHFMLGSNYSSTPSFSASNLSSKQTMTSSFGTSTSPSPPSIPHQSSSSLNEPMQSRLPPSDSTSESHLTPPVQPGDRSLRGGEEGEDGVSSCVSLEDRRITEDFTLSQHVSYTEQWKALRSKGTASVKNKGGSLKSKSSLQIRSVTSSLPVMREGILRREGIGSAKASLRGKGSSTSSLPVVLGKENKITFPLSERRSLESTLLKHRHSPRATKVRPGGFSESPLHISATSSTTTVARKPLPSRIPRLVRKGKERKSDDLSSTSTDTLMEDTGTTSSSRPASAKKSSPVKRGPSFLPASTRRRPHTEPLRRIARPACANIRVSAGPDYVPSRIQPDGGIMEYPVFDRSTRPAKLKLHDADDRTTNIVPQRFYKTPSQRKYYSMKALKHGIALIINNRNFKNSKAHPVREGTERDEYNLIQTFYYLGYRPVVCNDLNSAKVCYIFENLDSFLADSGASTKTANDSFVCCILSHGTKDSIIGSDSQPIPRDYIEQQTGRSLILNGKPKIFFMQACRGRDYGSEPVPTYRVQADGGDSDRADLYVCCAAVSGDKSFRDTLLGSWFITELCKILCEFGTCHNLNEIQTKLNAEVPQNPAYMIEAKDGKWHVQQPTCSNNTLKHDVHFFHK